MSLHLATAGDVVPLTAIDHSASAAEPALAAPAAITLIQRVEQHLSATPAPHTATALQELCQVRNTTLQMALAVLVADGQIRKDRAGYVIAR